jgi:hypothetical protein
MPTSDWSSGQPPEILPRYSSTAGAARACDTGRGGSMPSMKVTVSAAMRARDVSRPQPHHEAAAEEEVAAARPASPQRAKTDLPPLRGTGPARVPVPAAPAAPPVPRHRPAPPGNRPAGETTPKPGDSPGAAPGTAAGKPGPPQHRWSGPRPTPERAGGERREPATVTEAGQPIEPPEAGRPGEPHEASRPGERHEAGRAGDPPEASRPGDPPEVGRRAEPTKAARGAQQRSESGRPSKRKRVRRRRSHGR